VTNETGDGIGACDFPAYDDGTECHGAAFTDRSAVQKALVVPVTKADEVGEQPKAERKKADRNEKGLVHVQLMARTVAPSVVKSQCREEGSTAL
jgi:hypothetical protein